MPATTLGGILNAGLKEIREPEITALDADNILQLALIEEVNDTVTELRDVAEFAWTYKHATLTTTADVTDEYVAVTNGSTTVTSVDEDGAGAQEFGSVVDTMWFRVNADKDSYSIASVDSTSDPNTITLDTAYVGTTSTATPYRCLRDTYALSTADLDQIVAMACGEGAGWMAALGSFGGNGQIESTMLPSLLEMSAGDLHADTSGRPAYWAPIGNDASENRQIVLWPFPDAELLINIWYAALYSDASAIDTTLLGGDAPQTAYLAIEHRVRMRACLWEKDMERAALWEARYQRARADLLRRRNREQHDRSMSVWTGRSRSPNLPVNRGADVFGRVRRR